MQKGKFIGIAVVRKDFDVNIPFYPPKRGGIGVCYLKLGFCTKKRVFG